MRDLLRAAWCALRSLFVPGMLWHLLWPTLLALAVWGTVAAWFWGDIVDALLLSAQGWPLVGGWFAGGSSLAEGALSFSVHLAMIMLLIPLVYVSAAFIVSVFSISFMLERVAERDYAGLELRHGGSMTGSAFNALGALLLFVPALLISLPLWLVPGLGGALALLLGAWLNKRCYTYDALMNHADRDEARSLLAERRLDLWLLALGCGLLGFVPVLNLFVPAFTGLCFVHYLLGALRDARNRPLKDIDGEQDVALL